MKRKALLISLSIITIVIIVAGAYLAPLYFSKYPHLETTIYIRPDMTKDQLADSLKINLGEKFGGQVSTVLNLLDVDATKQVGCYKIKKNASPYQVARKLQFGVQSPVRFAFNYTRTLEQFAEKASAKLLFSKEELLSLLQDDEFCKKFNKTPQTICTLFAPDTYEFYWTVKPEDFVARFHTYYNKFWNEERLNKAKEMKLTPNEVATIASIVEEETAKSDERPKVARLYINRLRQGMLLQADPTVKFAIGDFSLRRIYSHMLKIDSPYNTYKYKGLPPGPIRFVSNSTLDAVLNAPQHNYIYMCAKEDFSGYHNFAVSYNDHLANARRYQRELNRRNIK